MNAKLQAYLELLKRPVPEPSLEPELDDIDEKADMLMQEQVALSSGAIRKGMLEEGQGSESPKEGDMVLFHLSLKKNDGEVLQTSRLEEGGNGVPEAFILGKGKRLPRGWEIAIQGMLQGERAAFRIAPELSFGQKDCRVKPPKGMSAEADLVIDLQLVQWYHKGQVRAVGDDGVILRTTKSSDSWEHPRPPFEVSVSIKARIPSSSGRQGEGQPFYSSSSPLQWALGTGRVSAHLEEGLSSMAKSEKAFVSCPADKSSGDISLLPPVPEGIDRVEYEVELHSMIQIRDMTGTGEVIKRRIKEGVGEFPIDCPLEDNAVRVHYKAFRLDNAQVLYDSRGQNGAGSPLEFDTGVDAVPEAVDMCIRLMVPSEIASVTAAAKYAYEGRMDIPEGCPENESIGFEIELVSFEKTPHWHSMTAQDKISRAEQVRQQGNVTFRLGQLRMARQKYLKALKLLDSAYDAETDEQELAASNAKASCQVNLALISQKEGNLTECFTWCDKALREQPGNAKAIYRKAATHALLGDYEEAEQEFLRAKEADPSTAGEVDREISRMRQREKAAKLKEKRELTSFFDRGKAV